MKRLAALILMILAGLAMVAAFSLVHYHENRVAFIILGLTFAGAGCWGIWNESATWRSQRSKRKRE